MEKSQFKMLEAEIKWKDEDEVQTVYCAIGDFDEDNPEHVEVDEDIFFWFASEADIAGDGEDFVVLSWSYCD